MSLYVDDFCICFRSKNKRTIERHLQQCLNRIEDWATRNSFKFSKSKTQGVHFCQQRKIHDDPALYIYGSQIPVVAESKFLGVIFDRKLFFTYKTLERMINKRLVWYLESNNLITKLQSGFRAERSTNDNLVRLETFIRDAFIKREHVVAVFFDLEKAYDTTWRYGILKDLHNFGMKGRLPNFIKSFLEDRTIQVRVGSTLSDLYDQE